MLTRIKGGAPFLEKMIKTYLGMVEDKKVGVKRK
jgi:hypothetical protein